MLQTLLVLLIFLSGCTTALWAPNYKQEKIDGFYINKETRHLIVSSGEFAYIFPIENNFSEALSLTRQASFLPSFEEFEINRNNQIKGRVSLSFIQKNPTEEFISKLRALGFNHTLKLTTELNGKRYVIEGDIPLEKLKNTYSIMIAQPRTYLETASKVVATPAAITYDSIVVVPTTLLVFTLIGLSAP